MEQTTEEHAMPDQNQNSIAKSVLKLRKLTRPYTGLK